MATTEAPAWINARLMEDALRADGELPDGTNVASVTVRIGTNPGDNYGSAIYRVEAALSDGGRRSLLVKALPRGEQMLKAMAQTDIFTIESAMLSKHVPRINELLKRSSCGAKTSPLAARCPLSGTSPSLFLVLEDLRPQGFRLVDRTRGLGLRHALIAIRSLARFHAASVVLVEEDPNISKTLTNFFKANGEVWKGFFSSTVEMSAEACRTIPGFDEYADILERFKDKAIDVYGELNDPKPNRFKVIVHGDFWANNMMFKYNEDGKPIDFRMVDFQLSHVASPAIDLLYFLTGNLCEEVFENHEDLLLREYHVQLTEVLASLGLEGPTLEELRRDVDEHSAYCLLGALCVWPFSKSEQIIDIEGALEGDSSNNAASFETDRMKRWLTHVLPEFKKRGWLDL